jgi:hypothetical protein
MFRHDAATISGHTHNLKGSYLISLLACEHFANYYAHSEISSWSFRVKFWGYRNTDKCQNDLSQLYS